VIASQGDAVDTGTLGFSDIGNAADYKVSHSGGSIGMSNGGTMAHAVWGAVSAQMSGGNAAAGAAGAFSGELATRYIAEKYWGADTPEKIAALKEDDREQLSLLGTLAAGLAGVMTGNSSAAATTGAIAGKKAVENNYLSSLGDIFGSQGAKYFEGAGPLERELSTDNTLTAQEKQAIRDHYLKGDLPENVVKAILENTLHQIL
jgi:filamentous hemagglutinin